MDTTDLTGLDRHSVARFFRRNYLAITVSYFLILFPSIGTAMGMPLINFSLFFEDLFRVQLQDPSEISVYGNEETANAEPEDPSVKSALRPVKNGKKVRPPLSCEGIEILGYEDWKEEFESAKRALDARTGNRVTPEMEWSPFVTWNSPAYATTKTRNTILGNLRSADVSVAVLGHGFDINSVLDQDNKKIAAPALERVLAKPGSWGYLRLYWVQIDKKSVQLTSSTVCDGFNIYNLKVR